MRGSLKQRSLGTWQLRWDGPRKPNGRRSYQYETVRTTKKVAQRILAERVASVEAGTYVARTKETVGEFMGRWLVAYVEPNTGLKTQQGYAQLIGRHIVPHLGAVRLQDLRPTQIQEMYREIGGRAGARSVQATHSVLHKALNEALKWGLVDRNAADATTVPRVERGEIIAWTAADVNAFLSASERSWFQDVYRLAIETGMRRGELAGLQWPDVDLEAATLLVVRQVQRITGRGLVVNEPKRASRRLLELSDTSVALLRSVRRAQLETKVAAPDWVETGHVFTRPQGQVLDPEKITADFARIVREAGLGHLTLHGLRHTNATLMIKEGVDVFVVSRRLGHASVQITLDLYGHLLPGMQSKAAGAIERQLGRG